MAEPTGSHHRRTSRHGRGERDVGAFRSWLIQLIDRAEDQVLSERQGHI
jgi:hypothetical protein